MEEIGYLMIQIFILLLLAEVFGKIMLRVGMPDIIGFIIAGVIFVNVCIFTDVGELLEFTKESVFSDKTNFLNVMGQLGLVFLLFGIGLETRLSELLDVGRNALVTAIVGIIFPFIGGFAFYFLIGTDYRAAIMLGTAIFAMSAVVCVKLLQLMDMTNSKLGRSVIGIAIFSDIICLILMAITTAIANPENGGGLIIEIIMILVFVSLVFLFIAHTSKRRKHMPDIFTKYAKILDLDHRDLFSFAIVLCLAFTAMSYVVGLSGIVGAFLAGMYFAEFESTTHIREKFETLTKFLLPFFFIMVGLRLSFDSMSIAAVIVGFGLAAVAIVTKFLGGYVGARMCKVDKPVSGFVASCMIARGDIAIIVATLALDMGLFGTDLYAAIIIMSVITQIFATPLMKKMFAKIDKSHPSLQDVPEY